MREKYKKICQSLHIGHWRVNFTEKQIQLDHYLQGQLQLNQPTIDFDHFFTLIIPAEREAIISDFSHFSEVQEFSSHFTLRIGVEYYMLEAVLNSPIVRGNRVVASEGFIRIVSRHFSSHGNVQKNSLQGILSNSNTQSVQSLSPKVLYTKLSMVCQTALIYPFSWDFTDQSFEFTIFKNNDVVQKQMSLSEFMEFVHEDDKPNANAELKLFAEKKAHYFKIRFRSCYFEESRWFEMSGEVLEFQEDNTPLTVIGVLDDITEHVIAQSIQGKNKRLLLEARKEIESAVSDRNLALDNLNTALVYLNQDFIVQWNSMKTMKKILGKNAYAIGQPCYKSTFNRDTPCEDCPVVKLFISKKTETHRVKRGREILEVMANPVFNDKKELIGGVLKLDKITERVKQEELISELNTLMDAILNHIPVYLYVKDPNNNFKYLYWNKALEESTQLPASKVIGRTDNEILYNKDARIFRKNDVELLQSRGKMYFIEEYEDPNGDVKVVSSLKTLIPAPNGKLPWILGISWDITELKKNEKELIRAKEKAEESNKLKSAFLANMSHEIRTPLNAIVGFSDLLSETEETEEKMEYIDIIKSNNDLLLQLISDILDLSKIEAQSIDFIYETVDIYEVVNQIVAASNLRKEAKVPVILDKYHPDCFIYTDKNRISQVLSNFIGNALKFTSEGNVKVGYHTTKDEMIKFYVSDTGTGIAPNQLNAVFERFVKLDTFKQGTGLGLSICKSIVEELNGCIGAESELGKGSCFWFTLPYKNIANESSTEVRNTQEKKRVISKIHVKNQMDTKPTILVAEDLDSNYMLVDKTLQSTFNLVRAYNGKEAIELYNKLKPDIILMDIHMPEMDGLQATREIRQKDQQIPIIAFSAYSYNANDEKARKAGCDDFIAKPVIPGKLREKINSYINFSYGGV